MLPRVIVTCCTYRRNDQLRRMLEHLVTSASAASASCDAGVVIVDDSADGQAKPVVAEFVDRFALGVVYRHTGSGNISIARNACVDAALDDANWPPADWIAMTDDDCIPEPGWIVELLACQRRTGADIVSGRMIRRAPVGAPRWIADQPFLDQGVMVFIPDAELHTASTHNSMVSAAWLRAHAELRFDPALGRLGGEDMWFFRTAVDEGARIAYAAAAVVHEDQPADRLRYSHFLRQSLWLGNSGYVTSTRNNEQGRRRMAMHGGAQIVRGLWRPVVRLLRRQRPQFRYGLAVAAGGTGTLLGVLGVRVNHH